MLCGLLEKARFNCTARHIEKVPKTSYHVKVFADFYRPAGVCSD